MRWSLGWFGHGKFSKDPAVAKLQKLQAEGLDVEALTLDVTDAASIAGRVITILRIRSF